MRDSKRDTDAQNSLLDSVGEDKSGMIWENGTETCKISYAKQIASPGLMHDTGLNSFGGNVNIMENNVEVPQNLELPYDPAIPFLGIHTQTTL